MPKKRVASLKDTRACTIGSGGAQGSDDTSCIRADCLENGKQSLTTVFLP